MTVGGGPYRRVEVVREAKRRYRLVPIARNGSRFAAAKTYVTRWNARRAARRFYPGVPMVDVDHRAG